VVGTSCRGTLGLPHLPRRSEFYAVSCLWVSEKTPSREFVHEGQIVSDTFLTYLFSTFSSYVCFAFNKEQTAEVR